jgi:hypothetical protein
MTPTNTRPRTAAREPRRAFLLHAASGLLAVLLAAQSPALAQGLIEFSVGVSPYTQYQVRDDGTGLRTLPFSPTSVNRVHATTRSDYPGGRQYLSPPTTTSWSGAR